MDRSVKRGIFLISYAIVLYLVLSHLGTVSEAWGTLMVVLRPILIGVVVAYILNLLMRPMETRWLAAVWRRCPSDSASDRDRNRCR